MDTRPFGALLQFAVILQYHLGRIIGSSGNSDRVDARAERLQRFAAVLELSAMLYGDAVASLTDRRRVP